MKTTVYFYRKWNAKDGKWHYSQFKSPADRILSPMIKGEIIPGTAEDVDIALLDLDGRYDPRISEHNS